MLHVVGFGGDVLEQLRWMEGVACLLSRSGDHLVMCWAPLEFTWAVLVVTRWSLHPAVGASGCVVYVCMFWKRRVVSAFCRCLL